MIIISCDICGKFFKSVEELKKHMDEKHKQKDSNEFQVQNNMKPKLPRKEYIPLKEQIEGLIDCMKYVYEKLDEIELYYHDLYKVMRDHQHGLPRNESHEIEPVAPMQQESKDVAKAEENATKWESEFDSNLSHDDDGDLYYKNWSISEDASDLLRQDISHWISQAEARGRVNVLNKLVTAILILRNKTLFEINQGTHPYGINMGKSLVLKEVLDMLEALLKEGGE